MNTLPNRGENPENKKGKFNLKEKKENTVHSLFEVEHFLCNFKNICKGIKLYKIIRKWFFNFLLLPRF